mmetsp:Transcript_27133/g.82249  ORF Transcript_27133/g.82249 Transcript_27133/m.82249 type:complete len:231 (+) Transcript_27133:665-1357(+)
MRHPIYTIHQLWDNQHISWGPTACGAVCGTKHATLPRSQSSESDPSPPRRRLFDPLPGNALALLLLTPKYSSLRRLRCEACGSASSPESSSSPSPSDDAAFRPSSMCSIFCASDASALPRARSAERIVSADASARDRSKSWTSLAPARFTGARVGSLCAWAPHTAGTPLLPPSLPLGCGASIPVSSSSSSDQRSFSQSLPSSAAFRTASSACRRSAATCWLCGSSCVALR